jgi:hypothetical protein
MTNRKTPYKRKTSEEVIPFEKIEEIMAELSPETRAELLTHVRDTKAKQYRVNGNAYGFGEMSALQLLLGATEKGLIWKEGTGALEEE